MKKVFKRFMKKSVGIMIVMLMLMLVTTFMSPITVFARTRTINTVAPSGALNMSIDSHGILKWDSVPGATGYTVSLTRPNMTELNSWDTTSTYFTIINQIDQLKYDSGQYTIKVSAKGVHAEQTIAYYYYTSSVDQMEAPTNLRWNGNTAEWDAVPGASVYYIELNNFNGRVVYTSTSNTHQDFSSFSPEDGWTFRVSARPPASGTLSALRNSLYIESPSYEGGTVLTHNVTFNLNGGTMSGTNPVEVNDGEKVTKPVTDPAKEGYTFEGWYADAGLTQEFDFNNTTIIADTTIYAKWESTGFTITYDSNGGTGTMASISLVPTDGFVKTYVFPSCAFTAPTGKEFDHWEWAYISDLTDTRNADPTASPWLSNSIVVRAIWKDIIATTHTITVINGTSSKTSAEKDETITLTASTPATGMEFDKWVVEEGTITLADINNPTTTFTMPEENVKVKATYKDIIVTPTTYNVTFNLNGGTMSGTNPVVVNEGEKATKPPINPTYTGHVFAGWYADAGLTQEFDFNNTTIIADTTIYAKWNIRAFTSQPNNVEAQVGKSAVYKFTFTGDIVEGSLLMKKNGDEWVAWNAISPESGVEKKAYISAESSPTTQTFVIWVKVTDGWVESDEFTVTWVEAPVIATHNVTFNLNGGTMSGTNPVEVNDGEKVTKPVTDPAKEGYTFEGWYADAGLTQEFDFNNTTIIADTTIYAKWSLITYKVSFNANGGSGTMSDATDLTGTYTLPESTFTAPSGKQFKGWSLTSDGTVITTLDMTEDKTVYAIWEDITPETYTVSFNTNGGSAVASQNKVSGQKAIEPTTPTKAGYTFDGWYSDAGLTQEFDFDNTTIIADTTIYAKWVLITYKVSFNANGGSGTMSDMTDLTGTYTLPESTFIAPSGKQFKGWSLTSDGTVITTLDMTEDKTVYAIWEDIPEETLTITGDNQTFTLGNTNDITITCSGALNDLTAIKVNGVELEEANRELASGSTVLTLKNSYLNTLSVGTYTVTFEYGANSKAATLNVVEATNNDDNNNNNNNTNTNNSTNNNTSNNPKTSYNVVDYVYTLIIGIICLAGGTVYLKRKKLFGNR